MPLSLTKKMSNTVNSQYTLFSVLVIVLFQISTVFASEAIQSISLSQLGDFEVTFSNVKEVNSIKGQSLFGEVSYKPGENYSVILPFDAQRISYHIENGSFVNKGDTIATVEGYDVHHFIDEFRSTRQILKASDEHFQTNKSYFKNKTIQSSQWLEITKNYFEAKLNFEHIQHQMSFLHIDENEEITLISPKTGIVKVANLAHSKLTGELAFEIIAKDSIKVKVTTPLFYASNLSHLFVTPECNLHIDNLEKIADKFHQILWASPKSTHCNLTLGQMVKVIPIQKMTGYKTSKSALFEFKNKNYIAIKSGDVASLITVELIGANNDEYYFTANTDLRNKQVLTSSTSILQGLLLGLGVE